MRHPLRLLASFSPASTQSGPLETPIGIECARPPRLPWLVDATAESFEQELPAPIPVLVDFWAPWCGPCKWVSPAIAEQARARAGQIKVVKLDIDTAPEIASRYSVQGIPTLMLARDGKEVDRLVGAPQKSQLESWLEGQLAV